MTFSCNLGATQLQKFLQLSDDMSNSKATHNIFQAAVSLAE